LNPGLGEFLLAPVIGRKLAIVSGCCATRQFLLRKKSGLEHCSQKPPKTIASLSAADHWGKQEFTQTYFKIFHR